MSDPSTTATVTVDLPTTVTPVPVWRSRTVQAIQIVGMIALTIGGTGLVDALKIIPGISPNVSIWLAAAGAFARFTVEPLVLLIGDLLDDGVKNDSFKIN